MSLILNPGLALMRCSVCGKEVLNWTRREEKVYCAPCFKSALAGKSGLSTQPNEEWNPRVGLQEIGGSRQ